MGGMPTACLPFLGREQIKIQTNPASLSKFKVQAAIVLIFEAQKLEKPFVVVLWADAWLLKLPNRSRPGEGLSALLLTVSARAQMTFHVLDRAVSTPGTSGVKPVLLNFFRLSALSQGDCV
jgi:hypothetical protein